METHENILFGAFGGEHQNALAGFFSPNRPADAESVQAGEHHIQYDEIIAPGDGLFKACEAVIDAFCGKSIEYQNVEKPVQDGGIIFNNKQARPRMSFHGNPSLCCE